VYIYLPEYLMKVIDETLRLVNISFVSFRQATKDVFVNGTLRALHSETSHILVSEVITELNSAL